MRGRRQAMRRFGYAGALAWSLAGAAPAAGAAEPVSAPRYDITVEKDVWLTMRDGVRIAVDVHRPAAAGQYPVLFSTGPYRKDLNFLPALSPFSHREVGDPAYFVPRGYVMVYADARGTGKSEGYFRPFSPEEQQDAVEAIAWAAAQPWSNGNVGMCGVSYYAMIQYLVAARQPPALKCIVPWEGAADLYRDANYHGGLWNQGFPSFWWSHIIGRQLLELPAGSVNPQVFSYNLIYHTIVNRLDGPFWWELSGAAHFDDIKTPMFSVGNWDGIGLHLRGNIEAFTGVRNAPKKLRVHVGGHTEAFYSDEGQLDMLRWYDYWLKGIDTGIMDEPPVKLFIRGPDAFRFEQEWPLARTQWIKQYLHAGRTGGVDSLNDGALRPELPGEAAPTTYPAHMPTYALTARGKPVVTFVTEPLSADIEITGPINLVLWVAATDPDMDIFAKLQDMPPEGPPRLVTKGWLKVSHRKLDPARSRPWRPYHPHDEEQPLQPGEVVEAQVELWPTSQVFAAGHRIRLDISSHDSLVRDFPFFHYDGTYKLGKNMIYHDAEHPSYLLLPVVPPMR